MPILEALRDGFGNLFIADFSNNRIRKMTPEGTITTVAGSGTYGYSGNTGPATSMELASPEGVVVDGAGNLYIADANNFRVRKVMPGGTLTTVAGIGAAGYSGDGGPATSAQLYWPYDVAVDGAGNLYIADQENNLIRKVTPAGTITTIAGNYNAGPDYGGDGGAASNAFLSYPWGVAMDGVGNLYIADTLNQRIRKVDVADAPSLTFASTNVGQASASQDVTVLNLGNAPLNISQISTAANFSLGGADTTCSSTGQTLASSASCVLGIEFSPAADGSISGNVALTDNALNASVTQTIAMQGTGVGLQSQTITFPNPGTQTYGVAPITLPLNASSGLAIAYTVSASSTAAVSGNILTITGAGSVTVTASQTGDGVNWAAATPVNQTFTVNPDTQAVVTVTAPAAATYGQTGLSAQASGGGGTGAYSYSAGSSTACSVEAATGALTITSGTGTCSITATRAADTNYNASAVSNAVTVSINKATASAMPNPATKVYGTTDPAFTGTLSGFLAADNVTASYSRVAGETVAGGPYTISATLSPAGVLSNYIITYNTANFTITQAPASVMPNAATKLYGSSDPTFTGVLAGFLPADNVTAVYTRTPGIHVNGGPYVISATLSPAGVLSNYSITYNTASFTIQAEPLAVTVSPSSYTRAVGTANPTFTGTVTGMVNNDLNTGNLVITYSTTATASSPIASYPVTATLSGAAAASYALTVNPGTLYVWAQGTDLIETTVGYSGTAASGATIEVEDTAMNQGIVAAGSSSTYYYLSTDGSTKGSLLSLRSVPTLASGASSGPATTNVTLPTSINGNYYVLVCANGPNSVVESNTTNNCAATGVMAITH